MKKHIIWALDPENPVFPDPEQANEDGLLTLGGNLGTDMLLTAYKNGIFPWYNEGDPILWWCPRERFIIRPSRIHISHSMKKFLRKHDVTLCLNRDFADTIHRCRIKRKETWITDEMEQAYINLHKAGFATGAEAFVDGELAGGLYGVQIGKAFFGESMFSDSVNGSKAALILLAEKLEEEGFLMIDCQFHTDHLESMGGERISWEEYKELLEKAL